MTYYIKLGILLAVFILGGLALSASPYAEWLHATYWYILGFFLLLTLVTHLLMSKGMRSDSYTGLNYFMGSNTVRMLVAGAALIAYLYSSDDKADRIIFVVNFFTVYLCFTLFEIWSVMANLRAHSGKPGSNGV